MTSLPGRRTIGVLALLALASTAVLAVGASAARKPPLGQTVLSPAPGSTVSGGVTWSVQVTGGSVTKVDFAVDGRKAASVKVKAGPSAGGTYSYGGTGGLLDTTRLSNGTHVLRATAYGRRAAPASTEVTVDVENEPGAAVAPTIVAPPVIRGEAVAGETLRSTEGQWTGTVPMELSWQWLRCDAAGDTCSEIPEATSRSYRLTGDDVGATLRSEVTAENEGGSASATSAPTEIVAGEEPEEVHPPVSEAPPHLSDGSRVGQTVVSTEGRWEGSEPMELAYQWLRCDAAGESCAEIDDATVKAFTLTEADLGSTVRSRVTATNDAGSASATSAPSAVVTASPTQGAPANVNPPRIRGDAEVGATLQSSEGQWNGARPMEFDWQWLRCDAGGEACAEIDGASSSQYVLTGDDAGSTLRARVTATNGAGSAAATSAPSHVVAGESHEATAPASISPPHLSDGFHVGQTVSATQGEWSGTTPIEFSFRWLRCNADGEECEGIDGADDPAYTLRGDDAGSRIRVRVTAENAAGEAHAVSAPSAAVQAAV